MENSDNPPAHMKEFPNYYERLERMEREAEQDWAKKSPTATDEGAKR